MLYLTMVILSISVGGAETLHRSFRDSFWHERLRAYAQKYAHSSQKKGVVCDCLQKMPYRDKLPRRRDLGLKTWFG
jgi:hypothetical protein